MYTLFFSIRPTQVFRNNILQNALMAGNTYLISNKLSLLSPSYYCKKFKRNLDDFQVHLLDELQYRFNVIGVTETNITDPNFLGLNPKIPCFLFEYVLTPFTSCRRRCTLPAAPFFLLLNFGVVEKDRA